MIQGLSCPDLNQPYSHSQYKTAPLVTKQSLIMLAADQYSANTEGPDFDSDNLGG
jgi:hypothetical protein